MSDGGRTTERETRFAKLTVKLLLAAEVKQDATVQWCEFQGYDYPLQLVSQIIARMVARIENDAREPFFLLASGAEHFVDDAWWEEFESLVEAIQTSAEIEILNELERLDYRLHWIVVENELHQHLSCISI